ncbi:hypothetical protein SLEP1_g57768 [Rubroshorea leprosula]|uniref:Disease resistance protein At4g27190-like leucine-rich repeats domain-containing protein n=1 Tax=Rubroshorea leprosula TaxID=152421 RepID=A0AAV5MNK2_9ROSI|nr:hypothetical protein SLEP1_g57768 [Rubroshorea leprosula]
MHDKGHVILNRLLNNCLVEEANKRENVKMHDVVRDMALRVKSTGPSKFMVKAKMRLTEIPEEDEWTEDLDKVSLMENEISYIPINMFPKCLMLSTLILKGNAGLRQIPECFLGNMPLLKFLDLSYTGIEALPNSLCSLKNLTALILCGCQRLERMPCLSKLKALKKLDLNGAGLLVAPEGIEMLENLEYLDLSCPNLGELPVGIISNLFRLQYLRKQKIFSTEVRVEEVARLEMLECFEGGFDWLKDFNSFVSKLNHFGRPSHYWLTTAVPEEDREGYFWKFTNNDALKRVTLFKCKMGGEDALVLPDDLQDLRIECCNTVRDITIFLKNLTQLQTYALDGCQGIECVVSSSSLIVMNNLEELSLWSLCSLRDLVKVEKRISSPIFSNLKELNVVACSKLNKLFPCELLQCQGLQNLEEIHVEDCLGMEEIIEWEEEEERNQPTTTTIFTLPKLRSLYLDCLPELKKICPKRGVMDCDSLNSICIKNCPEIRRIPLCLGRENRQPALPAIKVEIYNPKEWWESVEWENPNDKNVLQYDSCGAWVRVSHLSVRH